MTDRISAALHRLEQEKDCRILFAVESGSRAWGFASPDSDYDIRAVFVRPLSAYLRVGGEADETFSAMLPDDLDIVGWDLRMYLRHLLKSNASVLEWLDSPIVYLDSGLRQELCGMKEEFVKPVSVAFHYASLLRHSLEDFDADGTIRIKKLCYALRAGLCARWAVKRETMPPTRFADVLAGTDLSSAERGAIDDLLSVKANAGEVVRVTPSPALLPLIADRLDELAEMKVQKPESDAATLREKADTLFRKYVLG